MASALRRPRNSGLIEITLLSRSFKIFSYKISISVFLLMLVYPWNKWQLGSKLRKSFCCGVKLQSERTKQNKSYITFVIDPPLMMAQSRAESTKDTYNNGQYINQFTPNRIKVIREFEQIQKKICRHKMSIMINEICINEEMLPKYTYIYCHPQTDCFVLSELFSVARHAGRSKPGSKPVQHYVRLSFRPVGHQSDYVG